MKINKRKRLNNSLINARDTIPQTILWSGGNHSIILIQKMVIHE